MDNKDFNKGKVLVTGITGFKGFSVAKKLRDSGYCVYGLFRHSPRSGEPLRILRKLGIRTYKGNIKDFPYMSSILNEISPDYIIHLAALAPVSLSFQRWDEYYKNNMLGAGYLAEAAMRNLPNLKRFVFASTMEVYGIQDKSKGSFDENVKCRPSSPYAIAKLAAEQHILNMNMMYDFPSIAIRASNGFGRSFDTYFVVEAVINKILNTKTDSINLGTKEAIRSFIYIDDVANLYISAMETSNKKALGEVFNSGPDNGVSVEELVNKIAEIMKFQGDVNWNTREFRPGEIMYLNTKNDKAKKLLGWEPKMTLEEGLEKCVKYWKDLKKSDPKMYSRVVQ